MIKEDQYRAIRPLVGGLATTLALTAVYHYGLGLNYYILGVILGYILSLFVWRVEVAKGIYVLGLGFLPPPKATAGELEYWNTFYTTFIPLSLACVTLTSLAMYPLAHLVDKLPPAVQGCLLGLALALGYRRNAKLRQCMDEVASIYKKGKGEVKWNKSKRAEVAHLFISKGGGEFVLMSALFDIVTKKKGGETTPAKQVMDSLQRLTGASSNNKIARVLHLLGYSNEKRREGRYWNVVILKEPRAYTLDDYLERYSDWKPTA